ncbi:MAG: hypothetical protein N3A65_01450 [candidate division WOR-3 bacterium]|nr:hypothetical protein [candidate division WOR-3 bacterium]
MMRKILAIMAAVMLFVACDFARESVELKPDIEVTFINPVAAPVDGGGFAEIEEIKFVAKNSVDCTVKQVVWEYYAKDGTRFFGPFEIPIYVKVQGIVEPAEVDTSILENMPLPVDTVLIYLTSTNTYEAKAQISFIAYDDYYGTRTDTAQCQFGLYRNP